MAGGATAWSVGAGLKAATQQACVQKLGVPTTQLRAKPARVWDPNACATRAVSDVREFPAARRTRHCRHDL